MIGGGCTARGGQTSCLGLVGGTQAWGGNGRKKTGGIYTCIDKGPRLMENQKAGKRNCSRATRLMAGEAAVKGKAVMHEPCSKTQDPR